MLKQTCPESPLEPYITITDYDGREPHSFMTFFMNSLASISVMHSVGVGMNVTYLENLSTTTIIDAYPSTFRNPKIKSMEMLSHDFMGIWRGCSKLVNLRLSILPCWHTKSYIEFHFLDHLWLEITYI